MYLRIPRVMDGRPVVLVLVVLSIFSTTYSRPQIRGAKVACTDKRWVKSGSGCYLFAKRLVSWDRAMEICASYGAALISVGSRAERQVLMKELQNRIKTLSLLSWWIGLRYDRTEQMWRWEDTNYFSDKFIGWKFGEPNGAHKEEDCGELEYTGKLNDQLCTEKRAFVCEKDPQIKPIPLRTIKPEITTGPTTTTTINTTTESTKGTTTTMFTSPSSSTTVQTSEPRTTDMRFNSTTQLAPNRTTKNVMMTTNSFVKASPNLGSKQFCSKKLEYGIRWPTTPPNKTVRVLCSNGKDYAARYCGMSKWVGDPDVEACGSPFIQKFVREFGLKAPDEPITMERAHKSLSALASVMDGKELSSQDLMVISHILEKVTRNLVVSNRENQLISDVLSAMLAVCSDLLSENVTEAWSYLTVAEQQTLAMFVLMTVENNALSLVAVIDTPQVLNITCTNIEMQLRVIEPRTVGEADVTYLSSGEQQHVTVPSDVFAQVANSTNDFVRMVIISFGGVAKFLPTSMTALSLEENNENNKQKPTAIVGSRVLTVSLYNTEVSNLSQPVTFTMQHSQIVPRNYAATCRFLTFPTNETAGYWSDSGCSVVTSNEHYTQCSCDHLTNFAVLMDVKGTKMSPIHELSLRLITYIGCVISIVCLVTSWLTFQCLKTLQGERNSIHKNLVFCLFLAEVVFIIGIDKVQYPVVCSVIAGVLHYLFLAAFTWMLMEGVHILFMIVKVFEGARSQLAYYYFFGYGLPALTVAISAGFNYRGYGTDDYCWLTVQNHFIWSFAGPVAVILAVNLVILVFAMATVCKHSEFVMSDKMSTAQTVRGWIQGALGLEVVLGITWLFGYFYISQATITMAYIFTVLNSLQGLFIFIFHCILNKKVRKEYKSVVRMSKGTSSTNTRTSSRSGSLHRKKELPYQMYLPVEST